MRRQNNSKSNQKLQQQAENATQRVRPPKLSARHRRELHDSGIDDVTIAAAGIYTESNPAGVAKILGCKLTTAKRLVPAIVYPYGDDYARIKPDNPRKTKGKVVKYESPAGQPNRVYIPPQSRHDLPDASVPLLITEGEKKALCAAQRDYCSVGLVGVYGWKRKIYDGLLPDLARIPLRDREMIIVYDSDVERNPQVLAAESALAIQLQRHGARVRVARIPDGPVGANGLTTKVGLDDYIVAHGDQAFAQLIEAAQPPANLPPPPREDARKLDPADTVAKYLARGEVEGVRTLRRCAGTWFRWVDDADVEVSDEDVLTDYTARFLNPCARNVTRGVLQDHMTQLRAQAAVSGVPQLPAWVGPAPYGWNITDVVVCANGIVHLPSLESGSPCMIPHTPLVLGAAPLDIVFQLDASPPTRLLMLLDAWFGEDEVAKETVQKFFGYCLTSATDLQKMVVFYGPPRAGKSTLAYVLRRLLGDRNVAGPTLDVLASRFGLSALVSKSLAIIPDARMRGGTRASAVVELLLAITGEDFVTIDRKNRDHVNVRLPTRILMLTNELPKLLDASAAIASRIVLIPFSQSFLGNEDLDLRRQLDAEMPGILRWAIEGWRRLSEDRRLVEPTSSASLRRQLLMTVSPIQRFVAEQCVIRADLRVPARHLVEAYQRYLRQQGWDQLPHAAEVGRQLHAAVAGIGDAQPRVGGGRRHYYTGIQLRPGVERGLELT